MAATVTERFWEIGDILDVLEAWENAGGIPMVISHAFAQGSGAIGDVFSSPMGQIFPFVLIFVIMYFLIVRPQQKRVKQHQDGRAARTDGHVWDYFDIGKSVGLIAGLLTFIAAYVYCIATYGFLFGLGLGWLPSGILAVLVGWMTVVLWGPVLLIIAVVAFFSPSSHR